jgi:hypothetical protein
MYPQYPGQAPPLPQPQHGGALPPSLHEVPHDARLHETFGVGLGAVAIGSLILAANYLVQLVGEGFQDVQDLEWFGGTLVLGLATGAGEIFRRARATTIVPRGPQVGLYRGGKLDRVIGFGEIGEFRLRITNTIRELFAFGMLGVFGAIGAVVEASDPANASLSVVAWALAVGIACLGGFASSIWVRTLAKHYIVPRGGGTEHVVVLKSSLRRFGWIR